MALKTLGEQLETTQASIERTQIALENTVGTEHKIKRESLDALEAREKRLITDIEAKGADYTPGVGGKSPRRAYVSFS